MTDIPEEIISDILLLLPVKSLCRFRCVSKPWRALISDPEFVNKHLDLVKKHEPWKAMRYIIYHGRYALKSCSLFSLIHDPPGSLIDLYHPHKNPRRQVIIIGSCNGLVCYCLIIKTTSAADMFIWNPCTGEYKSCPFPFSLFVAKKFWSISVHGFYYDRRTDDYIIVFVHGGWVEIYSVKTNSWRRIEHPDCHNICDGIDGGSGKFVNGALQWKGSRMGPRRRRVPPFVISIDLAESVFREVPQPNNFFFNGLTSLHVQVIGESLSIFSNRSGHSVDVWIMKEYGVKESWTKLFSLPYTLEMTSISCYGAICTSKYILMRCNGNLALYDLDKKGLIYPIVADHFTDFELTFFMETLVSPNVYG